MPCCCMNDFASLSADFTTPHFSADLPIMFTVEYISDFVFDTLFWNTVLHKLLT